jgi:hypothetical protein
MTFIKILQRKDMASGIVAIALGFALAQFLTVVADGFSVFFSGIVNTSSVSYNWRNSLFDPSILLVLQIVILEVFARLTIAFRQLVINAKGR